MKKILTVKAKFCQAAFLSFFLFSVNAAHAGIVFTFGSNITPERQAAFEAAAADIEEIIDFKQDVKVSVAFTNLECDEFGAVLGSAGPQNAFRDFSGAPQSNTWYVSAQAADIGLGAAMAESVHIGANFNHNLGNAGCLPGATWYYGLDHNPGNNQIDFLSTVVHELMHGLGFLSFVGSNGALLDNRMDNYSTFLVNNSTSKSWSIMTNGERAASILNDNNLVWNGAKTTAMVSLLQAGTTNGKARLFAPSVYEGGSSTSHFDTSLLYDTDEEEVMEPYAGFPESSIMSAAAFCDMGWDLLLDTDGDTFNDCDDANPLVPEIDTDGDGVIDLLDAFPNDPTETTDTDDDGIGDNADTDSDNDGVNNASDNCPLVSNANQLDYDNDGTGDACGDALPLEGISGAVGKDKAGSVVAFAGDVDDDGYGDYVVGIPGYDIPPDSPKKAVKDVGRAIVISGKTGQELFSVNGVATKDAMGAAIAGGADIDDDGFDDVIVGAPKADDLRNTDNIGIDTGTVTVLYGPDASRKDTLYGDDEKILSGTAVALGDVNDDGFADIVIGAPKDDSNFTFTTLPDAGSVRVFTGDPAGNYDELVAFFGDVKAAYAGSSVAVGYVDAVAGADVIIGAPNDDFVGMAQKDNGSVTVYNLHDAGSIIPKKYGAVAKAFLGKSVAAGDVNEDGRDDVIAGAPGDDSGLLKDTGSVAVFSGDGGTQLTKKTGAVAKAGLGISVAAGDVNGDGNADIIAGASKDDVAATSDTKKIVDAGSVSIWSGDGYGLIDALYGDAAKDYFGAAVGAGDINSDGQADVIIGITGEDLPTIPAIKDAGAVEIVSGATVL